jgi:uncharacterized protein (DUF1697 family)
VGGHNKVSMKDLRALVESLGHRDVETYIQSGNVAFSAGGDGPAGRRKRSGDGEALEVELERAVAERLGVECGVVVVTAAELSGVVAANPFPAFEDPRHLHVVFRSTRSGPVDSDAVARAVEKAAAKGSPDQVAVDGRVTYLWTPAGLGRSELPAQLSRSATKAGTARNWATVEKLLSLVVG